MTKKSKFKSFILSAVPGLGHIYQGFTIRGAIFMGTFFCIIFLMEFLQPFRGTHYAFFNFGLLNGYRNLLELSIPIIWTTSVIDNLLHFDKFRNSTSPVSSEANQSPINLNEATAKSNKQLAAILLNIAPGAGHIYIGLKNKGFQLTCYFFLLYFAAELTRIDIFNIPLGLIWLYSILDTIRIVTHKHIQTEEEIVLYEDDLILFNIKNNLHWIGGILIFTGFLVIANRTAVNFIDSETLKLISEYLRDGIIAIVLIVIGLKMLFGNNKKTLS